jgi:hypothetical protein
VSNEDRALARRRADIGDNGPLDHLGWKIIGAFVIVIALFIAATLVLI